MAQLNANGEEGNPNGPGADQQPVQQPGLVPNGAAPNGAVPNGAVPNGAAPNGAAPNGAAPNGAAPNGAAAAAHEAVVMANVIANLAGALAPPGPMHPPVDVEADLLGPPPTKSNRNFTILPIIK